jgi:hypothetical protein
MKKRGCEKKERKSERPRTHECSDRVSGKELLDHLPHGTPTIPIGDSSCHMILRRNNRRSNSSVDIYSPVEIIDFFRIFDGKTHCALNHGTYQLRHYYRCNIN